MIDTVFDFLLSKVADRPLLLFVAFFAVLRLGLGRLSPSDSFAIRVERVVPTFVYGLALASLTVYAIEVGWYMQTAAYYDRAEPTITAVAWIVREGLPLYHDLTSADRYSHVYGPLAFLSHTAALSVFGPHIAVSKALSGLAALSSLGCLVLALRRAAGLRLGVTVTGIAALLYLGFRNISFWVRPEPLLLLATALGVLAVQINSVWRSGLGLGVLLGVAVNLKITAGLYFLPLLGLLWVRHRFPAVAITVMLGAVVSLVPFSSTDHISLDNYLTWLRLSGGNGLEFGELRLNVEWALFLLIAVLHPLPSERLWSVAPPIVVISLIAGLCGVIITAAKPGAGFYHLLPFVPCLAYLAVVAHDKRTILGYGRLLWPSGILAFVLTLVFIAAIQQQYFFRTMPSQDPAAVVADLERYRSAHPNQPFAIGYGGPYALSLFRPLPVFWGGRYLVDAPAVMEHELSNIPLPDSTVSAIRSCVIETWLIPRDAEPFDTRNVYPATHHRPIFSDAFRAAFFDRYRLNGHTEFYDVWTCERASVTKNFDPSLAKSSE